MPIYIKKPKSLFWTAHSKDKMQFYRLSESRVKRVLHSPKRIEEGIAPDTIAIMQPVSVKWKMEKGEENNENGKRKEIWTQEIWVMIEETKKERKIISTWRYPGMTKAGEPLPEEILREMREMA